MIGGWFYGWVNFHMKGFTSLTGNNLEYCVKDVFPSVVVSVIKLVSILDKGFIAVKWLT